jgi:hypothetical protein
VIKLAEGSELMALEIINSLGTDSLEDVQLERALRQSRGR